MKMKEKQRLVDEHIVSESIGQSVGEISRCWAESIFT